MNLRVLLAPSASDLRSPQQSDRTRDLVVNLGGGIQARAPRALFSCPLHAQLCFLYSQSSNDL